MEIPYDDKAKLGFVWLIWGLSPERCDLVAIATTDEAKQRYVEMAERHHRQAHVEKAFVDHLFGGGMLAAMNDVKVRLRR